MCTVHLIKKTAHFVNQVVRPRESYVVLVFPPRFQILDEKTRLYNQVVSIGSCPRAGEVETTKQARLCYQCRNEGLRLSSRTLNPLNRTIINQEFVIVVVMTNVLGNPPSCSQTPPPPFPGYHPR
jgi:hypothetical protein